MADGRRFKGAWAYPAVGLWVMLVLATMPGGPFIPGGWPVGGAFGAFTWSAWFACGALAVALGLVGARASGQARRSAWRGGVGFALLAAMAFGAAHAAGTGWVERRPVAALALALGTLWVAGRLRR